MFWIVENICSGRALSSTQANKKSRKLFPFIKLAENMMVYPYSLNGSFEDPSYTFALELRFFIVSVYICVNLDLFLSLFCIKSELWYYLFEGNKIITCCFKNNAGHLTISLKPNFSNLTLNMDIKITHLDCLLVAQSRARINKYMFMLSWYMKTNFWIFKFIYLFFFCSYF